PVHARNIGFDLGYLGVPLNDIEGSRDNLKGRAQLMSCIRGELTLNVEALLEAVQCAIDRGDQGGDLTWQICFRQADRGRAWTNRCSHLRYFRDGLEGASYCHRANHQSGDDQQWNDPPQVQHKFAQQRVNQYVSVGGACD